MTIPAINWQFSRAPGIIDPRVTFTRATTATFVGPTGLLRTAPANVPRFGYHPVTLECLGYLAEPQRTNLLLRSQEFDNASWTKSGITVSANSAVAPDGTTTADTLAATGTGAYCAQAVTITAGRGVAASFFLKAGASTHAFVSVSDGTNVVIQWFNLAAGTKGTQAGGGGTNLFAQSTIEDYGRGWYRCSVETTTATVTSITALVAPCAADGADTANADSCYAWGAQLEAEQTTNSPTSYIPTTTASATRNADNWILPFSADWYNSAAGTLIFDIVNIILPPTFSASQPMYGGFGNNSFADADVVFISRSSSNQIRSNVLTAANPDANLDRTASFTVGARNKIGLSMSASNHTVVLNGGTATTNTTAPMPDASTWLRMAVGCAPWSASSVSTTGCNYFRSVQYFPAALSAADLQALTAP